MRKSSFRGDASLLARSICIGSSWRIRERWTQTAINRLEEPPHRLGVRGVSAKCRVQRSASGCSGLPGSSFLQLDRLGVVDVIAGKLSRATRGFRRPGARCLPPPSSLLASCRRSLELASTPMGRVGGWRSAAPLTRGLPPCRRFLRRSQRHAEGQRETCVARGAPTGVSDEALRGASSHKISVVPSIVEQVWEIGIGQLRASLHRPEVFRSVELVYMDPTSGRVKPSTTPQPRTGDTTPITPQQRQRHKTRPTTRSTTPHHDTLRHEPHGHSVQGGHQRWRRSDERPRRQPAKYDDDNSMHDDGATCGRWSTTRLRSNTPQRTDTPAHSRTQRRTSHDKPRPQWTATPQQRRGDSDDAAKYTWGGHIFGQETARMIDYIGSDRRTACRALQGHLRRHLGLTTDHCSVGQTFDLCDTGWNASERATRQPPKPIGWQLRPHRTIEWVEHLTTAMGRWTPNWTMTDFKDMLMHSIGYGSTKAQRRSAPRAISTTEQNLCDKLHAHRHDAGGPDEGTTTTLGRQAPDPVRKGPTPHDTRAQQPRAWRSGEERPRTTMGRDDDF